MDRVREGVPYGRNDGRERHDVINAGHENGQASMHVSASCLYKATTLPLRLARRICRRPAFARRAREACFSPGQPALCMWLFVTRPPRRLPPCV